MVIFLTIIVGDGRYERSHYIQYGESLNRDLELRKNRQNTTLTTDNPKIIIVTKKKIHKIHKNCKTEKSRKSQNSTKSQKSRKSQNSTKSQNSQNSRKSQSGKIHENHKIQQNRKIQQSRKTH